MVLRYLSIMIGQEKLVCPYFLISFLMVKLLLLLLIITDSTYSISLILFYVITSMNGKDKSKFAVEYSEITKPSPAIKASLVTKGSASPSLNKTRLG